MNITVNWGSIGNCCKTGVLMDRQSYAAIKMSCSSGNPLILFYVVE